MDLIAGDPGERYFRGDRSLDHLLRERTSVGREGVLYFMLNGAGLVIQLSCLAFTASVLDMNGGLSRNIVLVIGIALSAVFRYWSCTKLVWRAQPPSPSAPTRRETVLC